ncbi:hypothetical protein E3N88_06889 [Mikania micrantha]|uniref:Uncharacterized protein n=1 Tax=Mikania micrantha TaxID=192012 RepID=A0A5N6PPZ2_9ASTR|nr:hypothetical protein E3N88_06889 [Mikania micrantha]
MSIKETRSASLDVSGTFSDKPLFFGGPLEDGLFLVRGGEGVRNSGVFDEVMNGLYYGSKESLGCGVEMVKRDVVGVDEFRFFDGYCGWEKEQLRSEIRAGYWAVAACSPDVVGLATAGSVGLWEEVLGLMDQKKVCPDRSGPVLKTLAKTPEYGKGGQGYKSKSIFEGEVGVSRCQWE